jgi:hypothetical protein
MLLSPETESGGAIPPPITFVKPGERKWDIPHFFSVGLLDAAKKDFADMYKADGTCAAYLTVARKRHPYRSLRGTDAVPVR